MRYLNYPELEYLNNPRDLLVPPPCSSLSRFKLLQDSEPGCSLLYDSCHKALSGTETLYVNISVKTWTLWKVLCKDPLVCMNAAETAVYEDKLLTAQAKRSAMKDEHIWGKYKQK